MHHLVHCISLRFAGLQKNRILKNTVDTNHLNVHQNICTIYGHNVLVPRAYCTMETLRLTYQNPSGYVNKGTVISHNTIVTIVLAH